MEVEATDAWPRLRDYIIKVPTFQTRLRCFPLNYTNSVPVYYSDLTTAFGEKNKKNKKTPPLVILIFDQFLAIILATLAYVCIRSVHKFYSMNSNWMQILHSVSCSWWKPNNSIIVSVVLRSIKRRPFCPDSLVSVPDITYLYCRHHQIIQLRVLLQCCWSRSF